jgi:hypothetical protein
MGDGELLWNAVTEAVNPIAHLEKQYEQNKLEKKIRDYFKKGAKGLDFSGKRWDLLVNEYADNVYSSLFAGLGDRNWLDQADFLLCVDAGVKDLFPSHLFLNVPQPRFESTVLEASDRACDEQRFDYFRWETIQRILVGKVTQKKVREAVDASRQKAVQDDMEEREGIEEIECFVSTWVCNFVKILAQSTQGDPAGCVDLETAVELFQALIQERGLPLRMTMEAGAPPPGWPVVANLMTKAFAQYGDAPCDGAHWAAGTAGSSVLTTGLAPVRPTSSTPSSSWCADTGSEPDGSRGRNGGETSKGSKGFPTRTQDAWLQGGGDSPYLAGIPHDWSQGSSWEGGNDSAEEPPAKRWKGRWRPAAN